MTDIVYFNGAYLPKTEVHLSPDDRGFLFADGLYEVILSYRGRYFRKADHLERLGNGLRALRIAGVDPTDVGDVAERLLDRNHARQQDVIVYIEITRGATTRKHAFPPAGVPPTVYAQLAPFTRKGDPERGVPVITVPDVRWARCDIKSVALLPNCLANQQAQEAGAHEALFVRDGVVMEATASSFFLVRDGVVRTTPLSNYILPGVTRRVVLELCRREGIPCREEPIFLEEMAGAEEMFLAGTTTEICPIVQVDGRPVGDGRRGPTVARLVELFRVETQSDVASVPSTQPV